MADTFEANFADANIEDDPAAEFLAREQDQLAGLEDENEVVSSPPGFEADFSNDSSEKAFSHQELNGPTESVFPSAPTPRLIKEEPEKIKKWREEQQVMLESKDAEEEVKKQELRDTAKKEIEDWYVRYKEQIEKAKLNNREEAKNTEKELLKEKDTEVTGQEWERITRLCDFNPKSSRTTKDTSRMRSIILQLKQSPLPQRT